jgi:dihydrofolate reductase
MKYNENIFHTKMSIRPLYRLIVAANQDNIIGVTDSNGNQKIPWSSKIDMQRFRDKTMDNILIMGRKTFESLPKRPLPGRIHVVITRTPSKYDEKFSDTDSVFFSRLDKLDQTINSILNNNGTCVNGKHIFVCGGEEIYRELLPYCDKLYITKIQCPIDLLPGDTVSKFICEDEWKHAFRETEVIQASDNCIFKTYERF